MAGGIEFGVSGFLAASAGTAFAELEGVALGGALQVGLADPSIFEMGPNDFPSPRAAALELKALVAGQPARRGPPQRINDENLATVLQLVGGSRVEASKKLLAERHIVLAPDTISKRVQSAPQTSPLAPFKDLERVGPPKRISDDDLLRILEEVGWVQIRAVARLEELGIVFKRSAVNKRVRGLRDAGRI